MGVSIKYYNTYEDGLSTEQRRHGGDNIDEAQGEGGRINAPRPTDYSAGMPTCGVHECRGGRRCVAERLAANAQGARRLCALPVERRGSLVGAIVGKD